MNIGIFLKIEVCEGGGVILYAGSYFIRVNTVYSLYMETRRQEEPG
jgi:hypothetical protein